MTTNPLVLALFGVGIGGITTGIYFLGIGRRTKENVKEQEVASGGRSLLMQTKQLHSLSLEQSYGLTIGATGIFSAIVAFSMMIGDPFRAPYNEFFGVAFALYAFLLIAGGFAITMGWSLEPASIFAGITTVLTAVNTYISAFMFQRDSYVYIFLAGTLAGVGVLAQSYVRTPWAKRLAGLLCIALALVALFIGANAMVEHVARGLAPPPTPST
ncbi:MAG: DUF981 family protein [Thaumarchaeota archaeon]|nr:DUF981 family protein [Nitrososphaerota archaeon]